MEGGLKPMNGRGIQTLIEAALLILVEIITWVENSPKKKSKRDHVSKG
jgi:hypothetical protein